MVYPICLPSKYAGYDTASALILDVYPRVIVASAALATTRLLPSLDCGPRIANSSLCHSSSTRSSLAKPKRNSREERSLALEPSASRHQLWRVVKATLGQQEMQFSIEPAGATARYNLHVLVLDATMRVKGLAQRAPHQVPYYM